jgi:hypothetical protein
MSPICLMFTAGLDVGRKRDRSVLTFLDGPELHHIVKLENTPFEEQADIIAYAVGVNKSVVYVDNGGMGVAMVDLLRSRGARVVPVDITSGGLTIRPSGGISVGHEVLFGLVRTFISEPDFRINPSCPYIVDLKDELKQLAGTFTSRRKLHAAARHGHDDFAFSFALAVLNFVLGRAYGNGAQA